MSRKGHLAIWLTALGAVVLIAIVLGRIYPVAGDPGDPIWTETVEKGSMPLEVQVKGTLIRAAHSSRLIARVNLSGPQTAAVSLNQTTHVQVRETTLQGHVRFISSPSSNGDRTADITLDGLLPEGAGETKEVGATILVGELKDTLYVKRPVHARANSTMGIFKTVDGGASAVRVMVKFGRASVNTIEVLDGLAEGDRIITDDMSARDNLDRIRLR